MRSLFKSPFNSPMRSPTAEEEEYAFKIHLTPGAFPYDEVTNIPASCSISGVRYGLVKGVVSSFASNMPPVEDKGLRGCPAFTQLAKYTEDLTNAAWGKSLITVTLAGSLQGANIHRVSETTDTGAHQLFDAAAFSGAADNSVIGLCGVFKYNGRNIELIARLKDGTYVITGSVNLQTGQVSNLRSGSVLSVTALTDGYYRIFGTVPVSSGGATPYIYFGLNNGTANYTGDGVSGVLIGQPTYINFGVNGVPFIPPYTPNNTGSSVSVVSEAATSTTGTSFDLDLATLSMLKSGLRGPNAQGHIELEFESNVDSGWLGNNVPNIMSINNSVGSLLYIYPSPLGIRCYDGTNILIQTISSFPVGQTFKIAIDYGTYTDGTQKMRLTVNGVKSSVVSFSGSFGTQDLRFFCNNTVYAGWIKNLSYSKKPLW